ncbi:MAG: hypothetical protein ACTIM4_15395 [Marinomonas sp.]
MLQLFWLPSFIWMTFFCIGLFLLCCFSVRRLVQGAPRIGIDDTGAYWQQGSARYRLEFVRVNGVQLIAKVSRQKIRWLDWFWPSYRVIYRDSLSYYNFRLVRSFAAQQKILKRSDMS